MKTVRTMWLTLALALASTAPALAVDTSKTYSSGLLIGIFLAFCALIVVVQLAPSIMMLIGFIKSLAQRNESKVAARQTETPSA